MHFLKVFTAFCFLNLVNNIAFAGDPLVCTDTAGEKLWDQQCSELSAKFSKEISVVLKGKARCAKFIPMQKQNTRCQWYPVQSRHIPGFIAEAFRSRRKDQRQAAFSYLEYFCKVPALCRPFRDLIDQEVKSHLISWRKALPDLADRAENLRNKTSEPGL